MSKPEAFIFDIDGTLADHNGVRSPYDETRVKHDKPVFPVFKVLNSLLANKYKVIFVSGRTEACREDTLQWIVDNSAFPSVNSITLFMRQVGDHRKDSIMKKEIYDTFIFPKYEVLGVFDDRMQVCRMLYENNIFCFNVNQGLKEF